MSTFKHLIITRFNLRNPKWDTDKENVKVLTDEWHRDRFKLFEDFCLSSLSAQTNMNFEWYVFFDTTTTAEFRSIIDRLKEEHNFFKPVFVSGMGNYLPGIQEVVSNIKEDFIITTRLDNDDCFCRIFVEEVQKRFDNQEFLALDFIDGFILQVQPEIKIGRRIDQFNPFITIIERNKNPRTVWSVERHSHWKREKNLQAVRNVPIWVAVIHAANKINDFAGHGHVEPEEFLKHVEIKDPWRSKIITETVPVSKWKFESLKNNVMQHRDYFYKILKRSLGVYKLK
ncbi:glycosyltransferase [Leeuwenhoekiella sp. NPDC079379]|uniref:glycosyltransferase n=1 Tax=Leeuwenhoekiella sp. NPDC079379 TaxID=3364122 RepID=UPI0037C50DF9